jgi:NADH dehydrogenase
VVKKKLIIAVTGSTGFVGTSFRKFLADQNIPAISIARKKHRSFKSEKTLISSSLDKISGLKCDVMVHLIGTGAQTANSDYESVNVKQTQKIIKLCKRSRIKKIIYISGLGVDESATLGYFISKLRAEKLIMSSGLDYTIFRASYIVGTNDPLTQNLTKQIKKGIIIIPGSGSYRLQPISIDDVCQVILAAATNKKLSNKIIDLVGPKTISFANYVKKFNNKKAKIKKIPLEQAYHIALNEPRKSLYGVDDLNIMVGDFTSNSKKLEKICGINLKNLVL